MCACLISVASRRSSEELIFGGKVTINGSVCNTPQVGALLVFRLSVIKRFF